MASPRARQNRPQTFPASGLIVWRAQCSLASFVVLAQPHARSRRCSSPGVRSGPGSVVQVHGPEIRSSAVVLARAISAVCDHHGAEPLAQAVVNPWQVMPPQGAESVRPQPRPVSQSRVSHRRSHDGQCPTFTTHSPRPTIPCSGPTARLPRPTAQAPSAIHGHGHDSRPRFTVHGHGSRP